MSHKPFNGYTKLLYWCKFVEFSERDHFASDFCTIFFILFVVVVVVAPRSGCTDQLILLIKEYILILSPAVDI
jgi:uncharacterized protein (DUF983 family)